MGKDKILYPSNVISPSLTGEGCQSAVGSFDGERLGAGVLLFGLIGHPLGHSFSARYFAEKFAAEGIDARYDNFDLADICEVENLRHLHGFNVTIPYKQAVIPYLDGMSDEARAIGAVNTVRVEDGRFYGYNTDVIGFRESLRDWFSEDNASVRSALVLGTGGASKAVCYALTQLGIAWQLVSRTPKEGCLTYNDLRKDTSILASTALIVNCTPLGTFPNVDACPDIPCDLLTPAVRLYDLVYNPEETLFLRRGREHGCPVKNGLEMLHRQAEAAWKIWSLTPSEPPSDLRHPSPSREVDIPLKVAGASPSAGAFSPSLQGEGWQGGAASPDGERLGKPPYLDIFLDFDDTLYNTRGNAEIALAELYDELGLNRYFPALEAFTVPYWQANIELWEQYSAGKITRDYLIVERFRRPLSQGQGLQVTRDLCLRASDIFLGLCAHKPGLVEGARELLDYLHPRYRLHLCSNGFHEVQYHKLRASDTLRYFTTVILSEDAGYNKPSPEYFDYAFRVSGANPATTLMIGDNPVTDIQGAARAGLDTILFERWGPSPETEATFRVAQLTDIINIL